MYLTSRGVRGRPSTSRPQPTASPSPTGCGDISLAVGAQESPKEVRDRQQARRPTSPVPPTHGSSPRAGACAPSPCTPPSRTATSRSTSARPSTRCRRCYTSTRTSAGPTAPGRSCASAVGATRPNTSARARSSSPLDDGAGHHRHLPSPARRTSPDGAFDVTVPVDTLPAGVWTGELPPRAVEPVPRCPRSPRAWPLPSGDAAATALVRPGPSPAVQNRLLWRSRSRRPDLVKGTREAPSGRAGTPVNAADVGNPHRRPGFASRPAGRVAARRSVAAWAPDPQTQLSGQKSWV